MSMKLMTFWVHPFESPRVCLDRPHCVAIVDPLSAVWALVVLQVRDRVSLPLEASGPVAANLFDLTTAAGRTCCDLKHCHFSPTVPSWMKPESNSSPGWVP